MFAIIYIEQIMISFTGKALKAINCLQLWLKPTSSKPELCNTKIGSAGTALYSLQL